MKDISDSGAPT